MRATLCMSFRIRVFISMSYNLSCAFVPGIDNLLLVFMFTVLHYITKYLTIRLFARDFYRMIVDEGAARVNFRAIEIESE